MQPLWPFGDIDISIILAVQKGETGHQGIKGRI